MPCLPFTVLVRYFLEIREESQKNKKLWKDMTRHKLRNNEQFDSRCLKRSRLTNFSSLGWHHVGRTWIRLLALSGIRGFLAFFRSSKSMLSLSCLLRGFSVSLLEYFFQNLTWIIVVEGWPFFLWEGVYIANIHQRFLSTIIPKEKDRDSFASRYQTLSGEDTT